MKKYPRKSGFNSVRLFKVFISVEIVAVAASYLVWNRMNNSRDFRKSMNDKFPYLLEVYYSIGEKFNKTDNTRSLDSFCWELEKKK